MVFKTFICYRGSSVGNEAGAQISKRVFEAIEKSDDFTPVFHAETFNKSEPKHYNFIRDAEPIIRGVTTFIVILCNRFFDNFFVDSGESYKMNPDSAACVELRAAFSHRCDIIPVLSAEFSWDSIDPTLMARLEDFFGKEEIGVLKHRSHPLIWNQNGMTDDELIRYFKSEPIIPSQNKERTDKKENNKQEKLIRIYKMIIERAIKLPLENLEMDEDAYKNLVREHKDLFHIPSGYINGVRVLQDRAVPCRGEGYKKIIKKCGLSDVKAYYYWQIKCDLVQESSDDISICAICFGTLILWRLFSEREKIKQDVAYLPGEKRIMDGSIALLMTLRDYEDFFWMSSWDSSSKGFAGTLNQTTLSVSTLLRCGFLTEREISNRELLFRFDYISGSIHFLMDTDDVVTSYQQKYWVSKTEQGTMISHAQTCFCFNTILKYYLSIQEALPRFSGKDKRKLEKENAVVENELEKTLNSLKDWGELWCTYDIYQAACITNLSRILSSLTGFHEACKTMNDSHFAGEEKEIKNLIQRILEKLLSVEIKHFEKLTDKEIFEEFPYIPSKRHRLTYKRGYERYENCTELLYINAIMSAYGIVDNEFNKRIKEKVDVVLDWFESEYVEPVNGNELIKSKRPKSDNIAYPLYCFYYYHMALTEYNELWGENT